MATEHIEQQTNIEYIPPFPINPDKIEYFEDPHTLDSRHTDAIMTLISGNEDNTVSYEYDVKKKKWNPVYYEWSENRKDDRYALSSIGNSLILLRKRDGKYLATKLERPVSKKHDIQSSKLETPENRNEINFIANRLNYTVTNNSLGLNYDGTSIALDIPLNKISGQAAYELKNYIGSLITHAENQKKLGNLRSELPYRNDGTDIKIDNHITDFADTKALSAERLSELIPKTDTKELEGYTKKLTTFINQIYTARRKK